VYLFSRPEHTVTDVAFVIENTSLLFNISVKRDVQPTILDVVSAQLAKPKDVSYAHDTSRR